MCVVSFFPEKKIPSSQYPRRKTKQPEYTEILYWYNQLLGKQLLDLSIKAYDKLLVAFHVWTPFAYVIDKCHAVLVRVSAQLVSLTFLNQNAVEISRHSSGVSEKSAFQLWSRAAKANYFHYGVLVLFLMVVSFRRVEVSKKDGVLRGKGKSLKREVVLSITKDETGWIAIKTMTWLRMKPNQY